MKTHFDISVEVAISELKKGYGMAPQLFSHDFLDCKIMLTDHDDALMINYFARVTFDSFLLAI